VQIPRNLGRRAAWFLVIILLGVATFFYLGGGPKTARVVELEQIVIQAPALLPMDVDKVTEVSMTLSGQRMAAKKNDGSWQLSIPYNDPANNDDIETVINLFSNLASDEPVEDPEATAKYGLNKPWAVATFVEDGQTHEFVIGKPGREELYYVKTSASDDVFLVRGIPEELALLRPIDLVNRQLLSFDPDDVMRIEAVATDGDIERIVERRDGRWFTLLGDPGVVFEVEEFLRDLQYVNVSELMPAGSGQGLSPQGSTMHIVLTREDGRKHILDIGSKTDDDRRYYVKSSDRSHVYQVVQFIAENLRDKLRRVGTDMMGLDPERVRELKISTVDDPQAPTEKVFTWSEGSWSTGGNVAFSVSGVLDAVIGVSAQEPAPDGDDEFYGFSPAQGSLQITATLDNKAQIVLDIGTTTPDGKHRYVRSSARKGVYLSPAENVGIITTAVAAVRSDLMVFNPDDVVAITVSKSDWSGRTSSDTITKSGSNWTMPGKDPRNADRVASFLKNLKDLGAEEIAPVKEDESEYGFYPAADSWRVELKFRDGTSVTMDTGGTETKGSGWFAIVNYYTRISDLTDIVMVSSFDIEGLQDTWNVIIR
jgi:hypothetical protein